MQPHPCVTRLHLATLTRHGAAIRVRCGQLKDFECFEHSGSWTADAPGTLTVTIGNSSWLKSTLVEYTIEADPTPAWFETGEPWVAPARTPEQLAAARALFRG